MPNLRILPSLLAAHMGRLEEACRLAETAGADGLHIDIMDGHFVPNLSMGPDVVRMARQASALPLNVHLMVTHPARFVAPFVEAGAHALHVHVEAEDAPREVLRSIRAAGIRPGLVLKPATPASAVTALAGEFDEVLCMTVEPGYTGQAFLPDMLPKLSELRRALPDVDLLVDGGVDEETGARCAAHGANVFVAGASLYRAPDFRRALDRMRAAITAAYRAAPG